MKSLKSNILLLGLTLILVLTPMAGFGQEAQQPQPPQGKCPGQGPAKCQMMDIPGLSDEQKSKIDALKTPHQQKMLEMNAEKDKLDAELTQLEIAEKPDMAKINAKIDEITGVENKMAKERSKHHQEVRALLTPEQRVAFDSRKGCCKQGMGMNMEHGDQGGPQGQGCPNAKKQGS